MGRIKELRELVAKGEANDEQKAELTELEDEAGTQVPADDDAAVDKMAEKLGEVVKASVASEVEDLRKEMADMKSKTADPRRKEILIGSDVKSVDDLSTEKVAINGRRNKEFKEVSMRTVEFIKALIQGSVEKLQVLTEGTAGNGGYLVPEEWANMIVEDIRDATVMRKIAAPPINVTADTFHLPRLDTRPQAQWRSEAAVKSTTTAQWTELVFTPFSLAAIVTMSQELVDDASVGVGQGGVVGYVTRLMVQALAEKEDAAFFTGSGSGQPKGITAETIGSVAKGTNLADQVIQLLSSLLQQGYRGNATWVATSNVITQLRQLKDSQNRYLLQDLAGDPVSQLLGRPIYEQNALPTSVLLLGDFDFYQIVDRQGISVRVSDEAVVAGNSAFEKNLVHVRVEKRVDGKTTLTAAFKKITGI